MEPKRELKALAEALLPNLPGVWELKWEYEHSVHFIRDDGLTFCLILYLSRDRATVKAVMPQMPDKRHHTPRSFDIQKDCPEMSFDHQRPADRVAREIMRRVVEPFAAIYPEILKRQAERIAQYRDANEVGEAIARHLRCKLLGDMTKGEHGMAHIHGPISGSLRIYAASGDVYIERLSVPANMAIRLAEFLGELSRGANDR